MGNRVYVGNLSYGVSTDELKKTFSQAGSVTDARVMSDKETGQSRGFGFVTFATDAEAKTAIDTLNGQDLGGRSLIVNEARERENRPGGGGGGERMSGMGGGAPRMRD